MDENTFLDLADAEMARLEAAIERACDAADVDMDMESKPGGILELEFEDGSKIIINRHAAAREIWVAARSGGFHYKPDPRPEGTRWVNTRDGEDLYVALARVIGQQSGAAVSLS
ncbi:iron donor protein CyaY [Uliginosibacterium sp. H3]|uniref:Iron-sulfur cluster assembly protein CyaY n=1 Tax=Uliginosibacterium silvisoli TaxID=3114758 RepID=A0ABU6JYT3_9RHOO|nr:iron donor protein CyaY [Uliginosibacterium sp. H3]